MSNVITKFKVKDENGVEQNAQVCYEECVCNKPTFKTINGNSIIGSGNIVIGGGSSSSDTGNLVVDLSNYEDGDTLLPEEVEALKDEKTLVLYKLMEGYKILLTTRSEYGTALNPLIQYRYTYGDGENNYLKIGVLDIDTISYKMNFFSEYVEIETIYTANDKLSRKMGVVDLSSYADGDIIPKGLVDQLIELGTKGAIYVVLPGGNFIAHFHSSSQAIEGSTSCYYTYPITPNGSHTYCGIGTIWINSNTRIFSVSESILPIGVNKETLENTIDNKLTEFEEVVEDKLYNKMTVLDFTGKVENEVLSQYDYNEIAADPKRVMLLVDDPEGNTASPVLMSYFGEDSGFYWFIGYYTTRSGESPSNSLYSFFFRVIKGNRKLLVDSVKKYDLSSLNLRAIEHNTPYEDYDEYKLVNNEDIYTFAFNHNGVFRIKNYGTDFTPEDQNVVLYFNFGFGNQFTNTGRYIRQESLELLTQQLFPDYDTFSFGIEGEESCFKAYPQSIDIPIYFKVTDNEVEVFIGREE